LVHGITSDVIQKQDSDVMDGMEAALVSLKIKNNIITMRFKAANLGEKGMNMQFYYKDCYIMDEENQKKYFLLKDADGQFIAGPKDKEWEGGRFSFWIDPGKSKRLWLKFPLPADQTKHITVVIPGFMPFEEIELSR
jgi:hypothetical protein